MEQDEFDTGARQLLNLGHTIGHGVEACSGYQISHGKAVAIGMTLGAGGGCVPRRSCPGWKPCWPGTTCPLPPTTPPPTSTKDPLRQEAGRGDTLLPGGPHRLGRKTLSVDQLPGSGSKRGLGQ